MSLKHAILGFLQHSSFSGYDLKKVFDTTVRHFWPADQSQIYRTLSQLTKRRWAAVEIIHQDDRPNRKVYHLTESGREELFRWLTTPLPSQDIREPFLIQVFFAGLLSEEEAHDIFERESKELQVILERYQQQYQQLSSENDREGEDNDSPQSRFFQMLTLEYGIAATQADLAWITGVIERLKNKRGFI